MGYYVGLDVSLETVSVCIVDETGKVMRVQEVPSTPETIGGFYWARILKLQRLALKVKI